VQSPPPALLHHAPRSTPPAAKSIAWERGGHCISSERFALHHPLPHARNCPTFSFFWRGAGRGLSALAGRCATNPSRAPVENYEFRVFVMPRNRHMTERDIMPPSSSPSSSLPWPRTMPDRQGLPELPALLASSFRVTACPRSSPPSPPAAGSNLERLPVSLFSSFPYCILKGV